VVMVRVVVLTGSAGAGDVLVVLVARVVVSVLVVRGGRESVPPSPRPFPTQLGPTCLCCVCLASSLVSGFPSALASLCVSGFLFVSLV
jgi:hypothetical protein